MKRVVIGLGVLLCLGWGVLLTAGDFNGDGTDDVAIFRPSNGMWGVRGITRTYLGSWNDEPVPGDYNGDGSDEVAIYRATNGRWAIQGLPSIYYGAAGDIPIGGSGGGDGDWYRSGNNLCALAAGNIGIGLGDPAYKVDVVGGRLRLRWTTNPTSEELALRTDGAVGVVEVQADNADLFLKSNTGNTCIQPFGSGNVAIGATQPGAYQLYVNGNTRVDGIISGNDNTYGGRIMDRGGNNAISFDYTGSLYFYVDGSYVKTFVINHPLDETRYLVHGTLEGPEAGVYYRGTARLEKGTAEITLPSYFSALTREGSGTILLTNIDGFDRLMVRKAGGKKINGGKFVVASNNPDSSQEFDWEVKAVRRDVPPLTVEPARSGVRVRGRGPYRFCVPAL